ncbi:hypothetical protein GCM10010269_26800 [Streptomyces humidus]|uniref:Uncharacterized protein n=1 Tax=Streptomyces humidus TaxID=52259 RepID=A0A918FVD8_9ACTN|nr:hypothetical protein GCM10010269_26800 [Streptomyces humidus]
MSRAVSALSWRAARKARSTVSTGLLLVLLTGRSCHGTRTAPARGTAGSGVRPSGETPAGRLPARGSGGVASGRAARGKGAERGGFHADRGDNLGLTPFYCQPRVDA